MSRRREVRALRGEGWTFESLDEAARLLMPPGDARAAARVARGLRQWSLSLVSKKKNDALQRLLFLRCPDPGIAERRKTVVRFDPTRIGDCVDLRDIGALPRLQRLVVRGWVRLVRGADAYRATTTLRALEVDASTQLRTLAHPTIETLVVHGYGDELASLDPRDFPRLRVLSAGGEERIQLRVLGTSLAEFRSRDIRIGRGVSVLEGPLLRLPRLAVSSDEGPPPAPRLRCDTLIVRAGLLPEEFGTLAIEELQWLGCEFRAPRHPRLRRVSIEKPRVSTLDLRGFEHAEEIQVSGGKQLETLLLPGSLRVLRLLRLPNLREVVFAETGRVRHVRTAQVPMLRGDDLPDLHQLEGWCCDDTSRGAPPPKARAKVVGSAMVRARRARSGRPPTTEREHALVRMITSLDPDTLAHAAELGSLLGYREVARWAVDGLPWFPEACPSFEDQVVWSLDADDTALAALGRLAPDSIDALCVRTAAALAAWPELRSLGIDEVQTGETRLACLPLETLTVEAGSLLDVPLPTTLIRLGLVDAPEMDVAALKLRELAVEYMGDLEGVKALPTVETLVVWSAFGKGPSPELPRLRRLRATQLDEAWPRTLDRLDVERLSPAAIATRARHLVVREVPSTGLFEDLGQCEAHHLELRGTTGSELLEGVARMPSLRRLTLHDRAYDLHVPARLVPLLDPA